MRKTCAGIVMLVLFLAVTGALGQFELGPEEPWRSITVEYLDGRTETFPEAKTMNGHVWVRKGTAGYSVWANRLSDKTLQELGLVGELRRRGKEKAREARAAEMERQKQIATEENRKFEADQKAKGLVKFDGEWVTPSRKQELIQLREAYAKEQVHIRTANKLMISKFRRDAVFKAFQPLSLGSLCMFASNYSRSLRRYEYYDGEIFFWLGGTRAVVADDEEYKRSLYWAGTWTYITKTGEERTVNCFASDVELARTAVRLKFGLYERDTEPSGSETAVPGRQDQVAGQQPSLRGFGSGFFVTEDGYLISNAHVVQGAKRVQVKTSQGMKDAKVIAKDVHNDLALLKVSGNYVAARVSSSHSARLGQTIFTLGFPLPALQGVDPKVTKGVISSIRGVKDDIRRYQIDAAVQPGNSGGPLADEYGNVIGVVVARLNDGYVMRGSGAVPQNVNYAVKKAYLLAFLQNYPDVVKRVQIVESSGPQPKFEDSVSRLQRAIALIVVR